MKTFIIIAVASLAFAGTSLAKPPSKHFGPWKPKTHLSHGYGSGPAQNYLTGLNIPWGPYKHQLYRQTSRRRAERLYQYRYPTQYPKRQPSSNR